MLCYLCYKSKAKANEMDFKHLWVSVSAHHLTQSGTEDTFVTGKFFTIFRFKSYITKVGAMETQMGSNLKIQTFIWNVFYSYWCPAIYTPLPLAEFGLVALFFVCDYNFSMFIFDPIKSVEEHENRIKKIKKFTKCNFHLIVIGSLTVQTGFPGPASLQPPEGFSQGWLLLHWLLPCHLCLLYSSCQIWIPCSWLCHQLLWLHWGGSGRLRGLSNVLGPSPEG